MSNDHPDNALRRPRDGAWREEQLGPSEEGDNGRGDSQLLEMPLWLKLRLDQILGKNHRRKITSGGQKG